VLHALLELKRAAFDALDVERDVHIPERAVWELEACILRACLEVNKCVIEGVPFNGQTLVPIVEPVLQAYHWAVKPTVFSEDVLSFF